MVRFLATLMLMVTVMFLCSSSSHAVELPPPAHDAPLASHSGTETIVLAGGCFWGIQAVFQHVKGVKEAISGYSGGDVSTANYRAVSTRMTGHAESVKVTFDPSQVTLGKILQVFFSVAHDPTELNRQGPDTGSEYRSAIFFQTPAQQQIAEAYKAQLQAVNVFSDPIVTEITPLKGFYPAEEHHQNFATLNPNNPYILINDAPKVANLKKQFPDIYVQP